MLATWWPLSATSSTRTASAMRMTWSTSAWWGIGFALMASELTVLKYVLPDQFKPTAIRKSRRTSPSCCPLSSFGSPRARAANTNTASPSNTLLSPTVL
ncbi:hypothetical protein DFH09DRAFT_1050032 [Mycena vulgaris]|nr:hypothetical protein DFH09DRAFT_1050032 [Mycena vulgaris]